MTAPLFDDPPRVPTWAQLHPEQRTYVLTRLQRRIDHLRKHRDQAREDVLKSEASAWGDYRAAYIAKRRRAERTLTAQLQAFEAALRLLMEET